MEVRPPVVLEDFAGCALAPEVSRGDVSVVLKEDGFAKRDAAGCDEKGGVSLLNPPEEVVLKS